MSSKAWAPRGDASFFCHSWTSVSMATGLVFVVVVVGGFFMEKNPGAQPFWELNKFTSKSHSRSAKPG